MLEIINFSEIHAESGVTYISPKKVLSLLFLTISKWTNSAQTKKNYLFRFLWVTFHRMNQTVPALMHDYEDEDGSVMKEIENLNYIE